jgi:uncharacterized SAM-binding protein YcdF (DUF218 family)
LGSDVPPRAARLATGLATGAVLGWLVADLNLPTLVSYTGDRSYLVLALAGVGALVWLTPLRRLLGAGTALLAGAWLAVCFTPLTSRMASGLVRSDPVENADVVFVFASRLQEDGDPTTDAASRLLKGVELMAEGRARLLVVSEIPPPSGPHLPLARAWLEKLARQGEVIAIGPIVNTYDEAVALARLCRERGVSRVLAVTSPTHTRRAAATLEKQGLAVISVPSIETNFDLERLRHPGDRRRAFGAIAHERLGLVVYRRRGWI